MIANLIEEKYEKVKNINQSIIVKIQKILDKEFQDFDLVKMTCNDFHILDNQVEFRKGNKRVVFYISALKNNSGSYVRKQSDNYNFDYEKFTRTELKNIQNRLNDLFEEGYSVKKIIDTFVQQGCDDLEIKKEGDLITIGYFHEAPVDCVKIKNGVIDYIVFDRQEKLNWLFNIYDKKVKVIDDYFNE